MNSQELSKCNIKSLRRLILILFVGLINSTFTLQAADYYWVGGTGNWSDYANHWATTSGGNIFHTSIPSLNDNVYFDSYSSSADMTLTLDSTFFSCRDMIWSGLPYVLTINGVNKILNIYGSLQLLPNMNINVTNINLLGSGNNTLTTEGNALDTLYFEGTGFYELLDSLNCTGLYIYNDSFTTNGFNIDAYKFVIGTSNALDTPKVNLNNSKIRCERLFQVSFGPVNLYSSNVDILLYGSFSTTELKAYGKSFRNIEFQSSGRLSGGVLCERLVVNNNLEIYDHPWYSTICHFVEIGGSAYFKGDITVDTLIMLNPGISFEVDTLNINNYLFINGNCNQQVTIKPIDNKPEGFINLPSGNANVDFCNISSIVLTSPLSIIANNSIDAGGNSGWTIISPTTRTLYWVGGNGFWSDESNWSLTSGGAGGECLPSLLDDVIFDSNSFTQGDSLKLDISANCKNFDMSSITFNVNIRATNYGSISLFGSLTLGSSVNFSSNFSFSLMSSDTGNTLTTNGNFIPGIFLNGFGTYELSDSINCLGININKGFFKTNNYNVTGNSFFIGYYGSADLGSSTLSIKTYSGFYPTSTIISNNTNLIFAGPQCQGTFSDAIFNNITINGDNGYFNGKFYCNRLISNASNTRIIDLTSSYAEFHNFSSFRKLVTDTIVVHPSVNKISFDTLMIGSDFISINDCNNPLHLDGGFNTWSTQFKGKFIKSSGTINLDHVYISDVDAYGGATFNATNSIDLGGNSGWNIAAPVARNLYWVGGGGNWNDPNHWALNSNGMSGSCYPNFLDSVFVDNFSFSQPGQTIYLPANVNAYIKNLEVTGIPNNTFLHMSPNSYPNITNNIYLDGSLILSPELIVQTPIELTSGLNNNIISYTGSNFFHKLTINCTGSYHLVDSINLGQLIINSGNFYSEGHKIKTAIMNIYPLTLADLDTSKIVVGHFNSETNNLISIGTDISITNYLKTINGQFNNLTFDGNVDVENNVTCNRLIANANFTGINSNITAGYSEFKGNLTLPQSLSADSVVFNNAGKIVKINQLNIGGALIAIGNGGFPIQIEGINGAGTINKTSGFVCLDYVWLKDITATGGAQFFAGLNSVDLGGNSGWNFSVCSPVSNVWPGDANYDLIVDNNDILNIGLAFGYTGPVRPNASLAWIAQPAPDWAFQFANFANLKHADTDGNGIVNFNDTTAVSLNYGLTHPFRESYFDPLSLLNPVLYSVVIQDTVSLSDTVDVEIYLGTNAVPVDSIYGIGFTVNFDTSLIDINYLSVDYTGCWMGTTPNDLILFHKNLMPNGKVDFALVRTNQQNTAGFGLLTSMGIVVVDNIGAKITTNFTISNVKAITASEFLLSIITETDSLVIDTASTVGITNLTSLSSTIKVYPNPVNDNFEVVSSDYKIERFEILNIWGTCMQKSMVMNSKFRIDVSGLAAGIYFLKLYTKEGIITKKIKVIKT